MAIKTYEEIFGDPNQQRPVKKSGIKTYEEVFSNTPVKKSGIKTYEDVFDAQPQAQPKEVRKPSLNETTTPWLEKHPTLKKNIFDPLGKLARAYEETGAGKFHKRASETALDVMSAQEMKPDRTSTDSKVADTLATGLGYIGGLVLSPGGTGTGLGSATLKTEQAGRYAALKASKNLQRPFLQKTLPIAGGGALAGGAYEGGASLAQGKDAKTIAKNSLIGMAAGAVLDPAVELGVIPLAGAAFNKLFGQRIKSNLAAGKIEKVELPTVSKIKSKATVKNIELEKAIKEYNDAIENYQNIFQTNELRDAEMAQIKPELDRLVANIERAENIDMGLSAIAERNRLAQAAGVMDRPAQLTKRNVPKSLAPPSLDANGQRIIKGINEAKQPLVPPEVPKMTSKPIKPLLNDPKNPALKTPELADTLRKERGFSENIRTDLNMNDQIRNNFTESPLTYEQITNKTTLESANTRFSKGYEKALEDWNNSINTFRVDDVPLSRMIANEAVIRGDMNTARKVLADVAEKLTQAGQYSQAARILRQADDPGAFMSYVQRQLNKLNQQGAKQYGNKWADIQLTDDELQLFGSMKNMDEAGKEKVMEELYDRIIKQLPVGNMEKFDAWRRMAMLLNPKTHVRNVGGNVIMTGLRKTADTIGAGIEKAIGLKSGSRTKSVGWSADKKLVETVENVWQTNKKELLQEGRYDIESLSFMNREKPAFKNQTLEAMNQFSKLALNAGDAPFVERAYKDALGQYMKANNLEGVSDAALDYAKRRAYEATFKQSNLLSEFISKAKGQKGIGTLVEAAIPFSKTPTNIALRAFEYSPMGLLKALYSGVKGKAVSDVIEDLAKGLTGGSIAGLGFLLADMGWARSERSKSKNAEAILQQMGEQPNSILTPLGSYTFDWAQPFSVPLAMGMVVHENLSKNEKIDIQSVADAVASGGDTIFNMSMLQTFRQLLGGGYGSVTEQIAGLPVNYVEQAYPTLLGQLARTFDSTRRSTYDSNPVKKLGKELIAKTPVLSKTLEPRLDVFGNEQKQGGPLQQFLSPGYWKERAEDPVTKEIVRLYKKTKETDILPKVAPLSFVVNGKKRTLFPSEVTQFQQMMGQKNHSDIKKYLATNPRATDEQRSKALAKIVRKNYDDTKKAFIPKKGK